MDLLSKLNQTDSHLPWLLSEGHAVTYGDLKLFVKHILDQQSSLPSLLMAQAQEVQLFMAKLIASQALERHCLITNTPDDSAHEHWKKVLNELDRELPPLLWLRTSGSSGTPKYVGHTFEGLHQSWLSLKDGLKEQTPVSSWGLALPAHHTGGLMVLLRQFFEGKSVKYRESLSALIEQLVPGDGLSLVPAQLSRLLRKSQYHDILAQLNVILLGGEAPSRGLIEESHQLNLPLILGYGMTETGSAVAIADCAQVLSSPPHFLGQPLLGNQFSLTSQNQIIIEGGSIAYGVIDQGEFKRLKGSVITNDLARKENNQFFYQGRNDLTFISGGENISPFECETLLQRELERSLIIIPRPHYDLQHASHLIVFNEEGPLDPLLDRAQSLLEAKIAPRTIERCPLEIGEKPKRQDLIEQTKKKFLRLKKAPRLVFLHGLFGHGDDFEYIKKNLIREFQFDPLQLRALTLPAHRSLLFPEVPESKEELIERLIPLIRRFREEGPLILIGYSLGGRIALELAHRYPEFIDGLVLMAAHPGLENQELRQERASFDHALTQQLLSVQSGSMSERDFFQLWYQNSLFELWRQHPHFTTRLEQQVRLPFEQLAKIQALTALSDQPNFNSLIKVTPTLYLYGDQDQKFKQLSPRYRALGAQVRDLRSCTHALPFEAPLEVAAAVNSWISKAFPT